MFARRALSAAAARVAPQRRWFNAEFHANLETVQAFGNAALVALALTKQVLATHKELVKVRFLPPWLRHCPFAPPRPILSSLLKMVRALFT